MPIAMHGAQIRQQNDKIREKFDRKQKIFPTFKLKSTNRIHVKTYNSLYDTIDINVNSSKHFANQIKPTKILIILERTRGKD